MSLEPYQWRMKRNAALRSLDVDWAREQMLSVACTADAVVLISLHKARYECGDIEKSLRLESGEWLRARGYTRRGGLPLAPPGELPT